MRRLAAGLALGVFALDQATKLAVLATIGRTGPVEPLPFLELILVWNRGISYGLLQQDGALGRWLLVGVTAAVSAGLAVWMWRTVSRTMALGLALVVGGAFGNLVDRVVYGAVVDFVHLHTERFSWYVFNVADAAIVVGVVVLVADSVFASRKPAGA